MNPLTPLTKKYRTSNDFMIRQSVKKELNKLIETQATKKPIQSNYELKVLKKEKTNHFSIQQVAKYVCEKHGQHLESVKSKSRKRELVIVRQEAMFILYYAKAGYSLKSIGQFFGNRDHSTVIHSCESIINSIETELGYKEEIRRAFLHFDPKFNFDKKGLEFLL